MSSFSIPPLSGGINFDMSSFVSGMADIAAKASQFPGMIESGIDAPLLMSETAMQQISTAAGGMGESVSAGIMGAEAAMQLFPPLIIELIENPLLGAAAAAKESLGEIGNSIAEMANHYRDLGLQSIKTGLDIETLSTFGAAARQSGVSLESLSNGMELLQQRAAAAMAGDAMGAKGFEQLGISAESLKGMLNDPKEMLLTVADAMAALPTQGERVRVAMEAMGRGGKEMLPFLQMGRAGIDELAQHLGDAGARVGEEEAGMGASWAKIGSEFSAMWEGIESAAANPILHYMEDNMDSIIPKVESMAKGIGDGIGAALQNLGPIIDTVMDGFSGIADVVEDVVVPAFELMMPPLKILGDSLKAIMDVSSLGFNGLATLLNAVSRGVDSEQASASAGRASAAAAGRLADDVGLGDGPSVHVHAEIKMDPHEASTQIASKLLPEVQRGYAEIDRKMTAAATTDKVKKGLGGKRQ